MKFWHVTAAIALAAACSGCASAIDGATQAVYVETTPVSGAACVCSNTRGQWPLTSPGTVVIKKSESVLTIRCSKAGYRDGTFYAAGRMSTAGLVGAMLPYVGLISSAVDASTGAVLTYPNSVSITLKPDTAPDATKIEENSQGGTPR